MDAGVPEYLVPYMNAAERHGPAFQSLLWASPQTQASRFDVFTQLYDFNGKSILDVGCGRADFLDFLRSRRIRPHDYIGIEAVAALADAAEAKPGCTIIRADFVREPGRMFVGADVIVFSGSLNTLEPQAFHTTVRWAFDATADALIFNFLCTRTLAAARYLRWHKPAEMRVFAASLTPNVRLLDEYLPGDCTAILRKESAA